ncbi:uncharacterized protein [Antedon mediterranea]|uniref:uncharacterized protein n=1 Tax=Antedon mediterranea TaxID=105859 RepID=UPI003AF7C600
MEHNIFEYDNLLKSVEYHVNWNLENSSKSFKSVKQSIAEHREDRGSFTIETLLFESYLHVSKFKGNTKNIEEAKKKNEESLKEISNLPDGPIKDGYKSIYWALKCKFATNLKHKKDSYEKLKALLTAYKGDNKTEFDASVCTTKGFALSMLPLSRCKESEDELKHATEICPHNVEWMFLLGHIKWRRRTHNLTKYECFELNDVKSIMDEVLKLDADHTYAKVILSDIYRREYETKSLRNAATEQGHNHQLVFKNEEDPAVVKIMTLLKEAQEHASTPRVLSIIAQCYIRMGGCTCRRIKKNLTCSQPKCDSRYFKEAHNVIEHAKKTCGEAACIYVQEAVLYREKKATREQLECLERAITLKPSDVGARLQQAVTFGSFTKQKEMCDLYDNLLLEFDDDPFEKFDINQQYAHYLISIKLFEEATFRKQVCLDIALESFVKYTSENGLIKFIDEYNRYVDKIIKFLQKHFDMRIKKSNGRGKFVPNLENAKLHEKVGNFEIAYSYYQGALTAFHYECSPNPNEEQKRELLFSFAKVNLKIGNLEVCSNMLAIIRGEDKMRDQENVRQLIMDLFVAKGEKAARNSIKAIRMFTCATEMGSLEGAKRLLQETKQMKDIALRKRALTSIASVANGNWCIQSAAFAKLLVENSEVHLNDDTKTERFLGETPASLEDTIPVTTPNAFVKACKGLQIQEYSMTHATRGICLIINNMQFTKESQLKERKGSEVDEANLKHVFNYLGFDVEVIRNATGEQMMNKIIDVRKMDHSKYDCFVCCILSHGDLGKVYGIDSVPCKIIDMTSAFRTGFCKTLANKPKLFFLQACQGTRRAEQHVQNMETDDAPPTARPTENIPDDADFLLGYATAPGNVSYRSKTYGSWYITKLTQNLKKFHHTNHILDILTQVNNEVSQAIANESNGCYKQVPAPQYTLRKNLYFPKL